jgi:hypothetical protein
LREVIKIKNKNKTHLFPQLRFGEGSGADSLNRGGGGDEPEEEKKEIILNVHLFVLIDTLILSGISKLYFINFCLKK